MPNPKIEMTEEIRTFLIENHSRVTYMHIEKKFSVGLRKVKSWVKELGIKKAPFRGSRASKYTPSDLEFILLLVSQLSNVQVDSIRCKGRKIKTVLARQVYCYLAHKYTANSYLNIGKHICNRDHGTVYWSLISINNDLSVGYDDTVELLKKLEAELGKIYTPVKRTIHKDRVGRRYRKVA